MTETDKAKLDKAIRDEWSAKANARGWDALGRVLQTRDGRTALLFILTHFCAFPNAVIAADDLASVGRHNVGAVLAGEIDSRWPDEFLAARTEQRDFDRTFTARRVALEERFQHEKTQP